MHSSLNSNHQASDNFFPIANFNPLLQKKETMTASFLRTTKPYNFDNEMQNSLASFHDMSEPSSAIHDISSNNDMLSNSNKSNDQMSTNSQSITNSSSNSVKGHNQYDEEPFDSYNNNKDDVEMDPTTSSNNNSVIFDTVKQRTKSSNRTTMNLDSKPQFAQYLKHTLPITAETQKNGNFQSDITTNTANTKIPFYDNNQNSNTNFLQNNHIRLENANAPKNMINSYSKPSETEADLIIYPDFDDLHGNVSTFRKKTERGKYWNQISKNQLVNHPNTTNSHNPSRESVDPFMTNSSYNHAYNTVHSGQFNKSTDSTDYDPAKEAHKTFSKLVQQNNLVNLIRPDDFGYEFRADTWVPTNDAQDISTSHTESNNVSAASKFVDDTPLPPPKLKNLNQSLVSTPIKHTHRHPQKSKKFNNNKKMINDDTNSNQVHDADTEKTNLLDVGNVTDIHDISFEDNYYAQKEALVNSLTDTIPASISWNEIREIDLVDQNLMTAFSITNFLPNLIKLNLSGNQIYSISANDDFKFIKDLNLSRNQLSGKLIDFNVNNHIEKINLSDNLIESNLSTLTEKLINLKEINLSKNKIKELTFLNPISTIHSIDLSYNNLSGSLDFAKIIEYSDNDGSNKSGNSRKLYGWPYVKKLNLSNNSIRGIKNLHVLESLEEINLEGNPLLHITMTKSLNKLRKINLLNTRLRTFGTLSNSLNDSTLRCDVLTGLFDRTPSYLYKEDDELTYVNDSMRNSNTTFFPNLTHLQLNSFKVLEQLNCNFLSHLHIDDTNEIVWSKIPRTLQELAITNNDKLISLPACIKMSSEKTINSDIYFHALTKLVLINNKLNSWLDIIKFIPFANLEYVNLSGNPITDELTKSRSKNYGKLEKVTENGNIIEYNQDIAKYYKILLTSSQHLKHIVL